MLEYYLQWIAVSILTFSCTGLGLSYKESGAISYGWLFLVLVSGAAFAYELIQDISERREYLSLLGYALAFLILLASGPIGLSLWIGVPAAIVVAGAGIFLECAIARRCSRDGH